MVLWPPSPSVEDEASALAKEDGISALTTKLGDEQNVPSQGSVDQTPVIVDSNANPDTPALEHPHAPPKDSQSYKQAERSETRPSFRSEAGLPTPPPSDNETRGRQQNFGSRKDIDNDSHTVRSKSNSQAADLARPRPSILRVKTDAPGELHNMRAGSRRAPSPYSYTRESGTFKVNPATRHATESYLSPASTTPSPVSTHKPTMAEERSPLYGDSDSATEPDRRSRKSTHFTETYPGPAEHSKRADKVLQGTTTNPTPILPSRVPSNNAQESTQLSEKNRSARDDQYHHGSDAPRRVHRSKSRPRGSSSRVRESPNSSSADERERHRGYKSSSKSIRGEPSVHHHSLQGVATLSDEDARKHIYRVREAYSPMTPPTVTTPRHMEDYFSKAFAENETKTRKYTPRSSVDETTILSPPTSPPRTPRSERPSRADYFQSPSSSPHRFPRYSRPPSIEESQIRDPKAHTSLLSQATSAAAVLATKTHPHVTKSASNAIETTFACTGGDVPAKSRSRASSPHRERMQRSDTFTYGEHVTPRIVYPPVPQSTRPCTREGLPRIDIPLPLTNNQPQRNASWTSYESLHRLNSTATGNNQASLAAASSVMSTSQGRPPPPIQRSQSASTPQEPTQASHSGGFPNCLRSEPTQGYRDWSTLKDIPDIDVCPDCARYIASTRYRGLLLRSLEKPFDKSVVCGLSRPWVRIAFTQSMKQRKSDLTFVRKVNTLPTGAWPCSGLQPDVRLWWKLIDPAIDRAVPEFFVCSACVGWIHQIFPDLPDQFERDILNQEKICGLRQGGPNFQSFVEQLDQIAEKCRNRENSSARYMQPLVDQVRRVAECPTWLCQKDKFLINRAWHYIDDLPEFTICDDCYLNFVWPLKDMPIARDVSKALRMVPFTVSTGPGSFTAPSNMSEARRPISCQLYSERMRRMFQDAVKGRLHYEYFRKEAVERFHLQHALANQNQRSEEFQKVWRERVDEMEKSKLKWKSLE